MTFAVSAGILVAAAYLAYHNKAKLLGLIVEGRRSNRAPARRHASTSYSRLETEEQEAALLRGGEATTAVVY